MTTEMIDHVTLERLVEAGAVRAAHVVGQDGGWALIIKYGMTERALAAQRSRQVRLFAKLETLVNYLKSIGLARFDVDSAHFDPDRIKTRTRPDRAAALKTAHRAAAHDAWFRGQVKIGLEDLQAGRIVSEKEHDKQVAQHRAELKARVTGGR